MTGAADASTDEPTASTPRSRWPRAVALVIGVFLLVAAIATVFAQRDRIGEALAAVRQPSAGAVALLAASIAANVAMTGLLFSILIRRHGRVGLLEMQALIASATLLNFVPLRPGLFGRVAYHKVFNAIPATATIKTVLQAIALSLGVAACLAVVLLVSKFWGVPLWLGVLVPVLLAAAALAWAPGRHLVAAGLVRYLEVIVWALRYGAAFALLGAPIDAHSALAFACIACVAMLVPLAGNGLGLREWATGGAAPLLTPYLLPLGLAAELVNRACELVVVTILGAGARCPGPPP
jgi:hypothetical protein